jgi:hypothetical protein
MKKQAQRKSSFFGRLFNYLAWEAGFRWSEERGRVGWGFHVQDPIQANDALSRIEVTRKAQHYERNNAIVNRLVDVFELFTVGAGGMPIIPKSSDEAWNESRKILWDRWCEIPDLTSLQTFGTLQGLTSRRWFIDGRILIFLTRSDVPIRVGNEATPRYRPRVQLIESSRLQNPQGESQRANIIDGIEVDGRGRPVAYWISESAPIADLNLGITYGNQTITPKPAANIIDVSEPMRPGEYHPFSFLAPVLNDIQDLDELCKLAKACARSIRNVKKVYKTETGELPDAETVRRNRWSTTEQTNDGTNYQKERVEEIQRILGSDVIAMRPNESLEQPNATTPNAIEQAHWDIIVNRICAGVGISKLLLFPNSMQGTVVRADLDINNIFFRARSEVLQDAFRRAYKYVTDQEARIEISIADRPFDWDKCSIQSPRGCNVDVGRNSTAMIAEYLAGMRSLQSIYAELGQDWKEQVTQIGDEKELIQSIEVLKKLPPGSIQSAISEALKTQIQSDQQSQQKEDAAALQTK